ncbi:DUF935 family protein [Azospirillum sp. 11R-A]|uniref:DUF935 domain-containing protein n=1 Tax=Azospirillum sp. 11R-A TaxID=3111634 RepID=UPI003C2848C4
MARKRRQTLPAPSASRSPVPADLRVEVASARNDITVPLFAGVLRPQDDVLLARGGGKGLRLYDEIERDAHAYAVLQKRKLAIVARDWEVRPGAPGRAGAKAAELVQTALDAFPFDKACLDLAGAILKGFAVGEVMWRQEAGFVLPAELRPRDQRRFVFDEDGQLRLLTWEAMVNGEELPDRKFVVHQFGSPVGDPYGLGLGHKLFWPVWFKRQGIGLWLVFAEKFGTPTVKGLFPPGTSDADQDKLLGILSGLSGQTAFIAPSGTEVSLLEAARSGAVTYDDLVRYMDEQISEAVLGETLTTNIGSVGSKAAAGVHNEVRAELTDADCDLLSGTLNASLVRWLVDVNMPGAPYPTVWRPRPTQEADVEDLARKRAERLTVQIGAATAARKAGYRPEDPAAPLADQIDGRWVLAPKEAAPSPSFAAPAAPRDVVDDLADQLDVAAAPAMDAMVDGIRALIDEVEATGGGLDEVARRLAALHPILPAAPLAELLAQAMLVAELGGRAEILDGASA